MVRPSKSQQISMQKKLRLYYERNHSASYAAKKTGINIKTVCNYFNTWTEVIMDACKSKFVERQHRETFRVILVMDELIAELYHLLDVVKSEISDYRKQGKEVPKYLLDRQIQLINSLFQRHDARSRLIIIPSVDETMEQALREKYGEMYGVPVSPQTK